MYSLPTSGVVIGTAAIDSINPFAIGLLVLIISLALGSGMSIKRTAWFGFVYSLTVFITYLLAGMGLIRLVASVPPSFSQALSIIVAVLITIVGVIEVKDYFWYGRGPSLQIPQRYLDKIHRLLSSKFSLLTIILLAVLVTAVELPSTGAPYLAMITIMQISFSTSAFMLLVLYNAIFVLPLVLIVSLVIADVKISSVAKWKESSRATAKLSTGLLLTILGWILILSANGTLNFG